MNRGSANLLDPPCVFALDASMRPRFMNRGSRIVGTGMGVGDLASMRPRFMNRGSTNTACAMAMGAVMLQ